MAITKLRVHIAPVGFEIDRIVLPALEMKADKVWLLIHEGKIESKAKTFEKKIKEKFRRSKIEVQEIKSDRKDVFQVLKSVREIIEKEKGNDIYLNVSSGSKIQAISCMMGCMMFNDKKNLTAYYAEPKSYLTGEEQQSSGLKNVIELPKYQIQIPKTELIQALKIIEGEGGKITKKQMAEIAENNKLISIYSKENIEQSRFASLDKNIIQPLMDPWNFINIEKIGRNRWIYLTDEGKNVLKFLKI